MRVSRAFEIFGPQMVASRLVCANGDYENRAKYEELARAIAQCPHENITLILERGEEGLKIAGVDNSYDVFKKMELSDLANLHCSFEPKMHEVVTLLGEYSFFKL